MIFHGNLFIFFPIGHSSILCGTLRSDWLPLGQHAVPAGQLKSSNGFERIHYSDAWNHYDDENLSYTPNYEKILCPYFSVLLEEERIHNRRYTLCIGVILCSAFLPAYTYPIILI